MFSDSVDFHSEDFFKDHNHFPIQSNSLRLPTMEVVLSVVFVVGSVIIIMLLCRCCCFSKNEGRVIAPPSAHPPVPPGPGLYPQQQYTTVTVPTVTMLPVGHSSNTSYPTTLPYPNAGAPYPGGGAPYPTGGAPYPTGGAPYPTGGAPYPTGGAPYPTAMPFPNPASAPDPNALPPSYEQVMGAEVQKQPPYNPYAPR